MLPPASMVWLNYNSMHLFEITKKSLEALLQLDYPDLEIILVDNNSSDGSREAIETFLQNNKTKHTLRFLKLKRNWGSTGANNIAYKKLRPNSKYLALTHNDVIPDRSYLKRTVEFLESHRDVGALQGIVVKIGEETTVDSSGFMANEGLFLWSDYNNGPLANFRSAAYVTIVEGTMPVYNLTAVREAMRSGTELFITEGFLYYLEDSYVSVKLWSAGYKCLVIPTVSGSHYRMGTSKKTTRKGELFYYLLRNRIALLFMTNSNGKLGFVTQNLRKLIVSNRTIEERKAILVSLLHGVLLGRRLRGKFGAINFYAAPFTRAPLKKRLFRWMH